MSNQITLKGRMTDGTNATTSLLNTATYTSSNQSIAKVVAGKIETYAEGNAIITAKVGAVETTINVTVGQPVLQTLEFESDGTKVTTASVAKGQTIDITL